MHQKEETKTPEEIAKNIIDEEEFELIKEKKVCKRDYKLQLEKIKLLRNDIIELDKNITTLKTTMIQKFEEWFFKRYGISVADLENPLLNQNDHEEDRMEVESTPKSEDIDEDALAYIQAKRKVFQIQKAKRARIWCHFIDDVEMMMNGIGWAGYRSEVGEHIFNVVLFLLGSLLDSHVGVDIGINVNIFASDFFLLGSVHLLQ